MDTDFFRHLIIALAIIINVIEFVACTIKKEKPFNPLPSLTG